MNNSSTVSALTKKIFFLVFAQAIPKFSSKPSHKESVKFRFPWLNACLPHLEQRKRYNPE